MTMEEHFEARIRGATDLQELTTTLAALLNAGVVLFGNRFMVTRQLVARVEGLKIEIFHREHPPPHFHVAANDIDAVFTIEDCRLLRGQIPRPKEDLIRWWYQRGRACLIQVWNATRPSDCPVGPIVMPDLDRPA